MRRTTPSQNTSPPSKPTPAPPRPPIETHDSDDGDDFVRTKILLLGQRRSGKTSILQVLFEGLNPKQSFFVEPTTRLMKYKVDTFIPLEIWDCPGTITLEQIGVPLSTFTTIIFVVDIQDSYSQPIARLIDFFYYAYQLDPTINFEVFVHKAEAMSEDYRIDSFKHFHKQLTDELSDQPPFTWPDPLPAHLFTPDGEAPVSDPESMPLPLHLTSVYDHTLQEAFSRVLIRILQRSCLEHLEHLLDAFITTVHASKAFLFDVKAKFHVATDQSPVDSITHGLCCDYVHMLNEFSGLYKSAISSPTNHPRRAGDPSPSPSPPSSNAPSHPTTPQPPSNSASRAPTPTHTASQPAAAASSNTRPSTSRSASNADAESPAPRNGANGANSKPNPASGLATNGSGANGAPARKKPLFYPSSSATLLPYTTLVHHQVTPRFALVALLPTSVWETKRGLVEYNVVFLREGVQEIYEVEQEARRRRRPAPVEPPRQAPAKANGKK